MARSSWLTYADSTAHTSPTGPDFYRDQFPYTLPPLVQFEREPVPLNPTHDIWITDTTFRDGQQSRAPYSVDQIVHLYSLLHRLGGADGMIRQSEFFLYTKKDREAVERCQELVKSKVYQLIDLGLRERAERRLDPIP